MLTDGRADTVVQPFRAASAPDGLHNETRALVRLSAAAVAAYCSYAICRMPLLPLFARDLGATPALVGLVVGASTVTGVLVKLPAGAFSDVVGRRPLLLAGAIVFATLPFTYVGVTTVAALIALRAVHGSASAIFGPVASATISDIAPASKRGTWLATYATVQGAGQAVGPVIAGYLMATGGFDAAFITAGIIALAAPFIVSRLPVRSAADAPRASWRQFRSGIADVLRNRLVLVTSAAQAAQFVLHGALSAFLPLFGRDVLGMSMAQLGWLFAVQTLTTIATRPLIGIASDRAGRRWVIAAGLVVCAGAVLSISIVTSVAQLMAVVIVYAMGVGMTSAAASAFITDIAPRARYGAAHGVFGTIYDIGDAAGPIVAGLLVASVGYAGMFRAVAIAPIVMAVVFALASRGRP